MSEPKKVRSSNLELLRILCIMAIVAAHFVDQSGVTIASNFGWAFFYCSLNSLARVACSVFVIISAWFSVGKEFRLRKIIHTWLTVFMFTVPITIYCIFVGVATPASLYYELLPIQGSPLWFAGYYIVLVMISPVLNLVMTKEHKRVHQWSIVALFIFMSIYSTVTADLGFFGHDIWVLIFLYLLTGYIRKYKEIPRMVSSLLVFIGVWLVLTLCRTYVIYDTSMRWNTIRVYLEMYRSRMQTIPNLVIAYAVFFTFYQWKLPNSKVINKIASATLGVYCFHQVPVWYMYLWNHMFKSTTYVPMLLGWKRAAYTICTILIVCAIGTVLEWIRSWLAGCLIENRAYCNHLCNCVDEFVNGTVVEDEEQNTPKLVIMLVLSASLFFVFAKVASMDRLWNLSLDARHSLVGTNFGVTIDGTLEYNESESCIEGTLVCTNSGASLKNVMNEKYPIKLGISIVDEEGELIEPDYMHLQIMDSSLWKHGTSVVVPIKLDFAQEWMELEYGVRVVVVQEGVAWFTDMEQIFEIK